MDETVTGAPKGSRRPAPASKLFSKGDVILTNPAPGFWGIAAVLSERGRTPDFLPMCHIAITPLLFQKEAFFSELDADGLVPLVFDRNYTFSLEKRKSRKTEPFTVKEMCIGVYTRRNKVPFKIIGKTDPEAVYAGPLPFEPLYGSEVTFPLYGDAKKDLGYEAYIHWKRNNNRGTEN